MNNLTIHYKNHYWNYNNVEEIIFSRTEPTMVVWTIDGKSSSVAFSSKEEQETVAQTLENGLMNGHLFIELGGK